MTSEILLPELDDSYDFIDIVQNNFGITSAFRPNPVLRTYGLGGCAALVFYDLTTRIGTMAHLSPSIMSFQRIQEIGNRRASESQPDHLLNRINQLFYALKGNGAQNTDYSERAKLQSWLVCQDDQLVRDVLARVHTANVQTPSERIFTNPDITAVALDTRNGKFFKVKAPIRTSMVVSAFGQLSAQVGNLFRTPDQRSL